jgi:hypothetical protein
MNYYDKYLKYRNKYLNLKALIGSGDKGSSEEIKLLETIKIGDKEYQIFDKKIASGLDGTIYPAKIGDIDIVVKIMPLEGSDVLNSPENIEQFIRINQIASEQEFGPKIYDTLVKDEKFYLFMDNLDGTLTDLITKLYEAGISKEVIKEKVKDIVFPIHAKMYENNISIGDDNIDNYMNKGDKWYRIDFNQSILHKGTLSKDNKKKYKEFNIIHPLLVVKDIKDTKNYVSL